MQSTGSISQRKSSASKTRRSGVRSTRNNHSCSFPNPSQASLGKVHETTSISALHPRKPPPSPSQVARRKGFGACRAFRMCPRAKRCQLSHTVHRRDGHRTSAAAGGLIYTLQAEPRGMAPKNPQCDSMWQCKVCAKLHIHFTLR